MKKKYCLFAHLLLCLLVTTALQAQVSYGGKPLPLHLPQTKSISNDLFVEMPAFDVAEQLRLDSLNESDLKSGYRFAYKFMANYSPTNTGIHFTLPDGTRVWRLGIRSAGALSINILFSEYELPEGAQLFLYNANQTQVLGAFNHLNNSDRGRLPVAPIQGDELIIEYQEPANSTVRGRIKVGEINHGYRSFKAGMPKDDNPAFWCQPPLVCWQNQTSQYDAIGRSAVLLMINGNILCSGTLVNNTAADGKPYLLTASHCLNGSFSIDDPDFEEVAGNTVCFFNYNSPLCSPVMRGAEEMSTASAHYRAVNEETDMALLELQETPPPYYQPYYAGWNALDEGDAPYTGIHHPGGTVKRICISEKKPLLISYKIPGIVTFNENSHWKIGQWNEGCTAGGSSGSALFDANNRIIGGLSGGLSSCGKPKDDFYYAFHKSWAPSEQTDKQLKYWLNPAGSNNQLLCDGLDPYASAPCYRLSNIQTNGKTDAVETTSLPVADAGYLFGTNTLGITEYAEAYKTGGNAWIHGTYIVYPAAVAPHGLEVEITVYSGSTKPETRLHTESYKPAARGQESFVRFSTPIQVSGSFFIGYKIVSAEKSAFAVFNLKKGETARNTAWIHYKNSWTEASNHPLKPFATSLFIDPVVQYNTSTPNEEISTPEQIQVIVGATRNTLHILLPDPMATANVNLASMDGKILHNWKINQQQTTLPISSVSPGVYIVQVTCRNKFFIQKVFF